VGQVYRIHPITKGASRSRSTPAAAGIRPAEGETVPEALADAKTDKEVGGGARFCVPAWGTRYEGTVLRVLLLAAAFGS
jgi:hypothetical protein